jgi:hypothetical protein
LKVGVTLASPPDTFAVYVGSVPSSTLSGHETLTAGHCAAAAGC